MDVGGRLTKILVLLKRAPDYRMTSTELKAKFPDYRGPADAIETKVASGDRKWRRDLEVLTARGLVRTCPSRELGERADEIELVQIDKPAAYFLSPREHRVLARARHALRPGLALPSPLNGEPATSDGFDLGGRVLRYLEENDGEVSPSDLCRFLGVRRQALAKVVRSLADVGVAADYQLVYASDIDSEEDADERAEKLAAKGLDIEGVSLWKTKGVPGQRRGLDNLGHFAYTDEEAAERLSLIAEALSSPLADDAETRCHLESAQWKLELWRTHLHDEQRRSHGRGQRHAAPIDQDRAVHAGASHTGRRDDSKSET